MTVLKRHIEDVSERQNLFSHHGRGMYHASKHHHPQNIISTAVRIYRGQLTMAVIKFTLLGTEVLLKAGQN